MSRLFRAETWSPGPAGIRSILRTVIFLPPLLFLLVFFFYPLINIFGLSLSEEGIVELFQKPYYLKVFWFTFWQAALSTILTLMLGLPIAYLFARYAFPGKSLLRALVTVPFVLPTVVVATAFRSLLGPNGPINVGLMRLLDLELAPLQIEQTITIILLAHIYYNMAVVVRLVGGFWGKLDPQMIEAAKVHGAPPHRAFIEITAPLLRPVVLSASALIFLFTFTSFGVILILGGPGFSTLETEIYRQYVTFLNPSIAAVLSLLQIIFTFLLMLLYASWQRRSAVPLDFRPEQTSLRHPTGKLKKIIVSALLIGLTVFMLSPLLILVGRSLIDREGNFTLAYYQALPESRRGSITFIPPLLAIWNSLLFAILTTVSAGVLGVASALMLTRPGRFRGLLEPAFMLPLGASAVTLGLAYVVTLGSLRTSAALVLIAHTLVALPFVVRSILPVLQGIQPNFRESAAVLGASPFRIWREVDLPIVGKALLVAAVFAFTVSMGEFGATSFIVRPNSGFLTLPIAIQRYLSQPGALNVAIERFRYADIGEF
jgi:thiamine transport system permease protein